MNRLSSILACLCILFLSACTQSAMPSIQDNGAIETEEQPDQDQAVSSAATGENTEGMIEHDENEEKDGEEEESADSADDYAGGDDVFEKTQEANPRTIRLTSDNWTFNPARVTASLGEKVLFEVSGTSEDYGFVIPELNIIEVIPADGVTQFVVPTNAIGSFDFFCTFPCEDNGDEMDGEFVISQ